MEATEPSNVVPSTQSFTAPPMDILAMAIQDAGIDKEPFMETTEPSNVDPPAQSSPVPRQDILAIKENETSVESVPKQNGEETQITLKSNGVSTNENRNTVPNKAIIIIRKNSDPSKNQCKYCLNTHLSRSGKDKHENKCFEFQEKYSVKFSIQKPISAEDEDKGNGFYCPTCHQRFKRLMPRNIHQKKAKCSTNSTPYGKGKIKCTSCDSKYQNQRSLRFHMIKKHMAL